MGTYHLPEFRDLVIQTVLRHYVFIMKIIEDAIKENNDNRATRSKSNS
jgi:hypothetical protein